MSRREIVHRCPPKGSGVTPCCGHTPFELPRTDRLTEDSALVTCKPMSDPTEEDLRLAEQLCGLIAVLRMDYGSLDDFHGKSEDCLCEALATFRAEARREARSQSCSCICHEDGAEIRLSEREACERIVEEVTMIPYVDGPQGTVEGQIKREILRRLRERAK